MTRQEAVSTIYDVVNSGIISMELEEDLREICNHICADDFEKCDGTEYCEGCKNIK